MSQLQRGQAFDGHQLPWNRRRRRRVERAKKIVIHLFSGPDSGYWEKALCHEDVEVLCVDLQAPVSADLHDDQIYLYLLSLAASGRVKAILGGPPCRTVSALRCQNDGGPGVLFFRTLALYVLCEDVRLPQEPQTALAVEQPEDPARYRSPEEVKEKKFMSVWRTEEWQLFEEIYQVKKIHFDQGPMGHVKKKPTTLAVVLRDIAVLNELRGPPSGSSLDGGAVDRGTIDCAGAL